MSEITTTTTAATRYEACQLVISGLESIRQGILAYHDLDLTINDLYDDLIKAGWSKSKRTLQRAATDLRSEGLLPAATTGAATHKPKEYAKSGVLPVENSTPLIHPEIVNHVTDVQPCYTSSSISGGVSNLQSKMDSSSDRCDKDAVPMGAANDRRAAEDLQEIVRLLNLVGEITARNCDIRGPHFSEEQWYLVWASLDSESREAKMRCKNYEAAIQRDCDAIRKGVHARFGSGMGGNATLL